MVKKTYAYEIYEKRNGEETLRPISQKRLQSGNYDSSNIFYSKHSPKEKRVREEGFNLGIIGLDKIGGDYADTVEWGSEGGKMGGRPKVYENVAQRQKAYRERKRLNGLGIGQGRGVRPKSYKYHSDRPATNTERTRRFRRLRKMRS